MGKTKMRHRYKGSSGTLHYGPAKAEPEDIHPSEGDEKLAKIAKICADCASDPHQCKYKRFEAHKGPKRTFAYWHPLGECGVCAKRPAIRTFDATRELTRALLAYLRFGGTNETCAAQKAYVDSLPWAIVEDVELKDAWRPTIMRIADRAGVADDDAAKAVQLSRSRGLDLGTSAEDAERLHAMVPFRDLFNHPSLGALEASGARERVGKASVFDSCVRWYLSDDRTRVLVDAPSAFATPASQELWLWYGYDAKDHGAFVEAYGFEPFD